MQDKFYICELCGKLTNVNNERVGYINADLGLVKIKNCKKGKCLKGYFSAQGCNANTKIRKLKNIYGRGNGTKDISRKVLIK